MSDLDRINQLIRRVEKLEGAVFEPAPPPSEHAELLKEARDQAEAITTCKANTRLLNTLADLVEALSNSVVEDVTAKSQPNEHAELLKEARELAANVAGGNLSIDPLKETFVTTIRSLADALEAYATRESEAVAACKTADRVISKCLDDNVLIDGLDDPENVGELTHVRLNAARHLCRLAHEAAPKGGG